MCCPGNSRYDQVTTRQTYTLTGMEGSLQSEGGKLTFREQDGIDYAASTVLATSTDCLVDSEMLGFLWSTSVFVRRRIKNLQ